MPLLHATCPQCQFPRLEAHQGTHDYEHAGEPMRVSGMEYCLCPRCQHLLMLDEQVARNRDRVSVARLEAAAAKWSETRAFKWPADGEATPDAP